MMESLRKKIRRRYFREVVIYFLTWCLVLNTWLPAALATPTPVGDGFTVGTGSITQDGNATNVVVNQTQSVIEWSSLDTVGGAAEVRESLNFSQGELTNSAVLNRVMSGYGTQFYGDLNAEGMRIFIVNPAGIVFGEGSTVNVTQLIASNLNITDEKFLSGDYEFAGDIPEVEVYERLGVINNSSDMYASEGVALIGRKILNAGTITTGEGGFVVMAAGDRVLLGEPGSHVLVEMNAVSNPDEGEGEVINNGNISAPAGTVALAAGDVFASALELPKVSGGVGRVEQNGVVNVDGIDTNGGNISLTAADEVVLASGSLTSANAGTDSDAGLVVAHSINRTTVEAGAQIQATGGHYPTTAGFEDVVDKTVEITGDYVNFAGDVDASATDGKRGKIVIDALDMAVQNGAMPVEPPDNTVYEQWIEQQTHLSNSTDVELVAHSKEEGYIVVGTLADGEITGGSGDIVMRTKYDTGGIAFFGEDPAAIHTTDGGNVYMLAGGVGITVGDITTDVPSSDKVTEPGKIRLLTTNGGDISTGQMSVDGGSYVEISAVADGDLTVNGNVHTITNQVPSETQEIGQARTCLVSEHGNVLVDGTIAVEAHGKFNTTADIHLDAGQNITVNLGGGQIRATAKTSQSGPANASVLIHAGKDIEGAGEILITDDGVTPTTRTNAIFLNTKAGGGSDSAEISSNGEPVEEPIVVTKGNAEATLDIDEDRTDECPDCPKPPGLVPPLDPWAFATHMREPIAGNVFAEDDIGVLEVIPGESWVELDPDTWEVETNHGTLIIMKDGSYQYTPEDGFVGQDRFTYKAKVTETGVETDMVEVTITVSNELPVANPGTAENHMGVAIVGPLNTNDIDDIINEVPYKDDLTVEIVEQPLYGTVTVQKDGDTWTYTYTPTPDENGEYHAGTDSFSYSVSDGQYDGEGNPIEVIATVEITLTNNPPVQKNDTVTIDQGQSVVIDVLNNDYDPDLPEFKDTDVLTVIQDSVSVKHGKLILNDDNTFTYIPDPGYVGKDSFTYAVKDGQSGQILTWTTVVIWVNAAIFIPAAPVPEPITIEVSGCPALIKWVAEELGTGERNVQIWMMNALASAKDIQPCDACSSFKSAATILQDADGTRVAALAQVISQFASSTAPPTEEQMASIANAIANDVEGNRQYAAAGEYLDALVEYVGILTNEMGFTADEAVQFATDNYLQNLVEGENMSVASFVAARLVALGGS
jgi:filamentous hemagglutinin family protein